jgi:outer membrane protein OmpA-like peptidoglycan-associated protein
MDRASCVVGLAAASVLLISGCASKDWVREYVGVQAAETNQHVAKVEEKANDGAQRLEARIAGEAQRTEALGTRVNAAETSIGEVRGQTTAAQDQANTALRKAEASDSRLTSLWASRDKRTPVETLEVAFGFDRWKLNDTAETALVALVKELKENPKLSVALVGFTDPVGPRDYNLQLSQRRVEAVQRFLVEHDVELWRIHTVGLGPLVARDIPNNQKRRVTVTLLTSE